MCRLIVLLGFSLILNACQGFHLRGSVILPSSLQPVLVQADNADSELADELSRVLHASGIALATPVNPAPFTIYLKQERIAREVLSIAGTGKAREYTLHYQVQFEFLQPAPANPLASLQTIALARDYLLDAADILGQEQQEALLKKDMEKEAALLILRQLSAKVRVLQ